MHKCSPFSQSTCFLLCPQVAYVCISHQRLSSSGQRESFRHWRSRRDQISVDVNTPNDVATNLALLTTPLLLFRRWLLVTSKLPVRVMRLKMHAVFSERANVCTTYHLHVNVHLVPRKACHSGNTVHASSLGISARHKYHRNSTSRRRHVINEVLMISRKW